MLESVFWNVLSQTEIVFDKYIPDLWKCDVDRIGNIIPSGPNRLPDIMKTQYNKIGIKEIEVFRFVYFKETFSTLANRMVIHINKNLQDQDIKNNLKNTNLLLYVGVIMCLYGKVEYDKIMNNIDEFLKYTTREFRELSQRYNISTFVRSVLQNTQHYDIKNDVHLEND